MNILLLSAYDAPSHRRWRMAMVNHLSDYQWTVLTLPPRHFSWRVRGNSLSWFQDQRLKDSYDLVIATSMTDLSALRGMVPELAAIPTILYFHENQFAYPDNRPERRSLEPAVLNLFSAICADKLVFNSEYNRTTFLKGVEDFLGKMPDHVPAGVAAGLLRKSAVLQVPLEDGCFLKSKPKSDRLTLLWNHRWEYDKGPDRLLAICLELVRRDTDFCLNLLGQSFRDTPEDLNQLIELLRSTGRLGRCGFVENTDDYRACLAQSDLVLSTAIHEFQGLSVLEAIAAGCLPVVPDRLCYPEFVAEQYRYFSGTAEGTAGAYQQEIQSAVQLVLQMTDSPPSLKMNLQAFSWAQLGSEYRRLLLETAAC